MIKIEKEKFQIRSENEFYELMESVDEELSKDGYLIPQRKFHAWFRISSRFGLKLIIKMGKRIPDKDCYTGDNLPVRIDNWYAQKYGNRMGISFAWQFALLIRGNAYKINIPTANDDFSSLIFNENDVNRTTPFAFGIQTGIGFDSFRFVEDLTVDFLNSLKKEELDNIDFIFKLGLFTKREIEKLLKMPLILQAKGDIDAAVSHIFTNPPQYGLSKWSSLQATEKIIKAYILETGETFKFTHDLMFLAEQAENIGLDKIPVEQLQLIQCPAGVRYGVPAVNLTEAINAHHSSLSICWGVAEQISIILNAKSDTNQRKEEFFGFGLDIISIKYKGDVGFMTYFDKQNQKSYEVQYDYQNLHRVIPGIELSAKSAKAPQFFEKLFSTFQNSKPDVDDVKSPSVKKIGRNELCLCGSGRKFKKCCG
jgi:hypothetical protein